MSEPIVTPAPAADPAPAAVPTPAKTFTQEDVDAIVGKRLAKAMKGMPSEEEMNNFRNWQGTQQETQTTIDTLTRERDTARGRVSSLEAELSALKQSNYVQSKGYFGDDAEFVMFKAAKMVDKDTTFEQAVDKIAEEYKRKPAFSWSAPVGDGSRQNTTNSAMNAFIRGATK